MISAGAGPAKASSAGFAAAAPPMGPIAPPQWDGGKPIRCPVKVKANRAGASVASGAPPPYQPSFRSERTAENRSSKRRDFGALRPGDDLCERGSRAAPARAKMAGIPISRLAQAIAAP
jgi:hypothetical protein